MAGLLFIALVVWAFLQMATDSIKAEKEAKREKRAASKHPLLSGIVGGLVTYEAMKVMRRSNGPQVGEVHHVSDELGDDERN